MPGNASNCWSFSSVIQASLPFGQSGYVTVESAAMGSLSVGILAAIACGALVFAATAAVWLIARKKGERTENRSALTDPIVEAPRFDHRAARWEQI
jgi:hypothetical protein